MYPISKHTHVLFHVISKNIKNPNRFPLDPVLGFLGRDRTGIRIDAAYAGDG